MTVKPRSACGLREASRGITKRKAVKSLDLRAYLGAEGEFDSMKIRGIPNMNEKIST